MGIQKIFHWKLGVDSCHGKIPRSLKGYGKEDNPIFGADSGDDLDECDFNGVSCELVMVEGQVCSIPYELFDLPDLREILSLDTWNSCLTEEERFSLSAYLPDMDQQSFWLTMKELFSGSDMCFGNPMDTFFQRLKGGFYPPQMAFLRESLQFLEKRKYYHALRSYHDKMAQMFIDMRRLWDECDLSAGVEERLYMWRTRRKRRANLLDLNAVPNDGYLLNEDVNSDAVMCYLPKRMKTWESFRPKNIVASPSANGMNIIASNCSTKGVLKVRTSGNAIYSHNQKTVLGDISEQCRSVPKGLLKVVPKAPVQPELSKVFSRRSQTELLIGAQELQDCKVSYSPASAYVGNAGGFSGRPILWQKVAGSKMNPEQPQRILSCQDGSLGRSRYLQNSGENISKEVDIVDLGKHKLIGHDEERGSNGGYESVVDVIGSKRYNFGGQNLWQNFDMGKKALFDRSLDSYPFAAQYHEGERQTRIMQTDCMTILPRVPEAVSRNSGIGGGMQASPNVENSEKPGKPNVSEKLKYDLTLPLTYKRRKSKAKNSSDFTDSLMTGTDLRSSTSNESNQPMGESLKALKIKFMGWENSPLNRES